MKINPTIISAVKVVELGKVTTLTMGGGSAGCECLTKPAYA